jgi:hypothetical protein
MLKTAAPVAIVPAIARNEIFNFIKQFLKKSRDYIPKTTGRQKELKTIPIVRKMASSRHDELS